MTTKITSTKKSNFSAEYGNSSVFMDSIALATTDIDAADIIKLCFVPGGTDINRVVVKNTDMDSGTALTAKIGFSPADGSSAPSGADTAVAADGAWSQTAATTTYEIFPAYRVEKDSYLTIVIGTGPGTAVAGTVHAKVNCEIIGIK